MQRLAVDCPLPLMLDESIFGKADVIKTGELNCAQYIKFKCSNDHQYNCRINNYFLEHSNILLSF